MRGVDRIKLSQYLKQVSYHILCLVNSLTWPRPGLCKCECWAWSGLWTWRRKLVCTDRWHVMWSLTRGQCLSAARLLSRWRSPASPSASTRWGRPAQGAPAAAAGTPGARGQSGNYDPSQPRKKSRRRIHRSPPSYLSYNLQSLCQWDFCFHVWMFTLQSSSYKTFQQRFCSTNWIVSCRLRQPIRFRPPLHHTPYQYALALPFHQMTYHI